MNIKSVALFSKIHLIGSINPKAWDALIPHTPFVFSDAHVNLLAADLVRQISAELPDQRLQERVFDLSQKMARSASEGLASSWEPGDELCPPWRWPFPFPHVTDLLEELEKGMGPHVEPWQPIPSAGMLQSAYQLTQVAALTSDADFSRELLRVATTVVSVASRTLVDDFERCGTLPRPKFPKKILTHAPELV
ncbi:hypothetical protein [Hymenobacter cellulosilyticus]|uniref:Uncharacterized protein n=1 Tax=Hymenobacter cellulosilyticus TaxID=2932248 RepID=A0A8T9Q8F4_9BACT|nr:hypothetical protein [Hymenobacter cellulosilyticus]UOQ72691.1 hypothetical protein MUN79_01465 [Hymenobacter cellulosilyticus]